MVIFSLISLPRACAAAVVRARPSGRHPLAHIDPAVEAVRCRVISAAWCGVLRNRVHFPLCAAPSRLFASVSQNSHGPKQTRHERAARSGSAVQSTHVKAEPKAVF